jgi:Ala-tRNA(Pro) deacylase
VNVQQFLRQRDIAFRLLDHEPVYGAQSVAQAVHVSGEQVAKAVLLKAGGHYALALLPATHTIDLETAARALGVKKAELASEKQCGELFADCELGALPPFGSQYGVKTLMDRSLSEDEEILFEGNTHHEAIRMRLKDFTALEEPVVARFSHHVCKVAWPGRKQWYSLRQTLPRKRNST